MSIADIFQQLEHWLKSFAQYHYLGVFLISLIGSMSIFFPIPYTVVIFYIAADLQYLNPLLIALASGVGSAIGEFTGYLLGLGGRKIISEKRKRQMEALVKIFGKYGPIAILLFALTPLPDDLLFIPLGMMNYNLLKAFIPAIIGKICMSLIIAYGARYFITTIKQIFGIEKDWITALTSMTLAIILFIIVLAVMFKIDWEKIAKNLEKGRVKKQKHQQSSKKLY
ncbi:VTT domain-containing protein [Candidatus Bathyarchaeota archaeon]|nr:VTT domain-containing protein [Candidatus Bathyarchaeota archaeon]